MQLELRTICSASDPIPAGEHTHKCGSCGTCWRHGDDIPGMTTEEEFWEAHSCPKCGREETFKHGMGEPLEGTIDDLAFEMFLAMLEDVASRRGRRH